MVKPPRLRSVRLSRLLGRARGVARQLDRALSGLEVVNATAEWTRGPAVTARMRTSAEACFVLSTGRCGTLLLTDLLATCPQVDAHHEPEPRLIAASYLAWTGTEDDAFWQGAVAVARDRLVIGAHRRGKLYVETANRLTFVGPALAAVYPRARFLHLVREPEGFIRSAVSRGYFLGHPWDHARPAPRNEPRWPSWSAERRAAWLWAETNRFAVSTTERLGPERVLRVRSADLFGADVARAVELFRFLGLSPPDEPVISSVLARRPNAQSAPTPWGRALSWSDGERADVLGELAPLASALGVLAPSP